METGGIILGIIALIFGIDSILFFKGGSKSTISAWFYYWLKDSFWAKVVYFTSFIVLTVHFWTAGKDKK